MPGRKRPCPPQGLSPTVNDIEDDGARQKLATLLLDCGDRVRKSVYEADLDDLELRKVLQRAEKYIGEGDSLRVYPLCRACPGGVMTRGRTMDAPATRQVI